MLLSERQIGKAFSSPPSACNRMKSLICAILLCAVPASAGEIPAVNIPPSLWQRNWLSQEDEGSCVHASAVMLWRWQGQYAWADYWKKKYRGGEYESRLHARCDKEGVTYCDTYDENDISHLTWAVATRRGAVVCVTNGPLYGYRGEICHAVCLVHLDEKWAGILDCNDTGQGPGGIKWVGREAFLRDWLRSGSWAWSPVSTPPAPPQLTK